MVNTPWPVANLVGYILDDSDRAKTAAKIGFVIGGSIIAISFIVYTSNFTQNNYSPKALSRYEIYRQTRNQFS